MINTAIEAAKSAGKILMDNYGKIDKFKVKEDTTLVTKVDIECEERIKAIIGKKYPDHGFIGEEEGVSNRVSDYIWVIDPLDGTHNYIYGSPLFGVSIGLAYREEIIAGVAYFPFLNQLFTAEKGKGSFVNGKKLEVSDRDLSRSIVSVSQGYFKGDIKNAQRITRQVLKKVFEIRITGCASYNIISVATKTFDAMFTPRAKIWDMAAGTVIVQEAGGLVTDFEGKPITLNSKTFLATNKKHHKEFLELLK